MFHFIRTLLSKKQQKCEEITSPHVSDEIQIQGMMPIVLSDHFYWHHGLPIPDWSAIHAWLATAEEASMASTAYGICEHAWLSHFAVALGSGYHLSESDQAIVLSSLEPRVAKVTLAYIEKTLKYILHTLDGLAHIPPDGKDILIVFDGQDDYYRYVSYYYPEDGEFAFSGGMYIGMGCGHFVTIKDDLSRIEPIIVHEMTHACLSHLSLPLWLDEGLAVNIEQKLTAQGVPQWSPQEMRKKHLQFWGKNEIQQFSTGESFERPDDGNLLSYDLARLLVEQLSQDWGRFCQFVLMADQKDGGDLALREIFGVSLGELLSTLLGKN